ncbi:MAG: hypothetical protein LBF22_10045 [Deltaproteobacteria bacterium]|jgi:Zn-dependent peptidase ImmA (M78 family)|nr:hypothetical protein [Deltaproteobacteria bacterium]
MDYPKIKIDFKRYEWAIEKSDVESDIIFKKFPQLNEWISGSDQPTMKQLADFSEMTHIPLGYFFIDNPPLDSLELLKFRRYPSKSNYTISRNFLDTLEDMDNLKNFMREYSIYCENTKNSFVGSLKGYESSESLKNEVRTRLNIDIDWFKSGLDTSHNFNYIKSKIQALDIIVMMNSVVGLDFTRPLDIKEFYAFTMIDDFAPLIFINAQESFAGRLFFLIREFTYVGIGVDNLTTDKICNSVASEILVPSTLFKYIWHKYKDVKSIDKIQKLALYFKVNNHIIALRAIEYDYITELDYYKIDKKLKFNRSNENKSNPSDVSDVSDVYDVYDVSDVSDVYDTFISGYDNRCLKTINESTKSGYLLYTDAYRLTGTDRIFYDEVMNKLENDVR